MTEVTRTGGFVSRITKMAPPFKYVRKYSEFEIQAYVYQNLRDMGHDARGEVQSTTKKEEKKGKCIFDIVVFENWYPIRIIEIKRSPKRNEAVTRKIQIEKYLRFGVGIDLVCGMNEARKYMEAWRANGMPLALFPANKRVEISYVRGEKLRHSSFDRAITVPNRGMSAN